MKTTPLSGEPDLFKGPSPEANPLIQTGVESMYGRFLSIVAAARHKTPQQVDRIAQGRVWDGGTARQIGLVDGFGGMHDAIAKAAELAQLGDERGVRYLEPPPSLREAAARDAREHKDDDTPFPPTPSPRWLASRSSSLQRLLPRFARSSPGRASRRAVSNARRLRRPASSRRT